MCWCMYSPFLRNAEVYSSLMKVIGKTELHIVHQKKPGKKEDRRLHISLTDLNLTWVWFKSQTDLADL